MTIRYGPYWGAVAERLCGGGGGGEEGEIIFFGHYINLPSSGQLFILLGAG